MILVLHSYASFNMDISSFIREISYLSGLTQRKDYDEFPDVSKRNIEKSLKFKQRSL